MVVLVWGESAVMIRLQLWLLPPVKLNVVVEVDVPVVGEGVVTRLLLWLLLPVNLWVVEVEERAEVRAEE